MIQNFIKIFHIILLFAVIHFTSCSDKEDFDISENSTGQANLKLRISPSTDGSVSSDVEVIKSVRVLLVDNMGKITANERHDFNSQASIDGFSSDFEFMTKTGKTNVYVIANEESIEEFNVENDNSLYLNSSLKNILNNFTPGKSGFETFVNSIYFKLDSSKPLPLTSMYEIDVVEGSQSKEIYLVNTSVKFEIKFSNYRSSSVTFKSVGIDQMADKSYLMANIDPEYQKKDGIFWIDWMKKVTEETNKYPDLDNTENSNNNVNEKLGWLTNYNMPNEVNHSFVNFFEAGDENNSWIIDPATSNTGAMPTPTVMEKGPFYFPESKYIPNGHTSQSYTLVIQVETTGTEEPKTLRRELGYIKTLFRNTKVVLYVDMYSGSEDIYAEIIKWGESGWTYGQIQPE